MQSLLLLRHDSPRSGVIVYIHITVTSVMRFVRGKKNTPFARFSWKKESFNDSLSPWTVAGQLYIRQRMPAIEKSVSGNEIYRREALNGTVDPWPTTTYITLAASGAEQQKSILNDRHYGQGGSATLSGSGNRYYQSGIGWWSERAARRYMYTRRIAERDISSKDIFHLWISINLNIHCVRMQFFLDLSRIPVYWE